MRKEIKAGLLGGIVIILFLLNGMLFQEDALVRKKLDIQKNYEEEYRSEMEKLESAYEEDLVQYETEFQEYQKQRREYEEECERVQQETEKYDAEYQKAMSEYEKEMSAYRDSLNKMNSEKQRLMDEAEKEILKNGIIFTVKISAVTNWNDHVGHEWSDKTTVNGQSIRWGDRISIKWGQGVSCKTVRTEIDTYPDIGSGSSYYVLKKEDFRKGFSLDHTFSVYENRGRYAGNSANFTYTYEFEPERYIVTIDESKIPEVLPKPDEPKYQPPKVSMQEPTEPIEPKRPTGADVSVKKPDLSEVQVYWMETFRYSQTALIVFAAESVAAFLLVFSRDIKRRIQK